MSLLCSSILLQQYPRCLVCLTWMVLEMGGRLLDSCCFERCCFQDLFNIAYRILEQFSSSFFSIHVVHPYCWSDIKAAWKKLYFILLDKSDFHIINNLLKAIHTFTGYILMSFSVDEMLLLRYLNLSTNFRNPPFMWRGFLLD